MRTVELGFSWLRVFALFIFISFLSFSLTIAQKKYFKGNTHAHTTNSDGKLTPLELMTEYQNRGYNFLVVTDHHVITNVENYSSDEFIAIPGTEVTFYRHITTLNPSSMPPFVSRTLQEVFGSLSVEEEGLSILAHPRWKPTYSTFSELYPIEELTHMEIHNAYTEFKGHKDDLSLWDSLLTSGKPIYGIASDDAHSLIDIGKGWVMVEADTLTTYSIIDALSQGRFYSTTGIDISPLVRINDSLFVESHNADTIIFYGSNSRILQKSNGNKSSFDMGSEQYVRVVAKNTNGLTAWSQPFWGNQTTSVALNLVDFNISIINKNSVLLKWSSNNDKRNNGYEIERYTISNESRDVLDKNNWIVVGFVKNEGNNNSLQSYSFIDNQSATGKSIYRIKQVNFNGKYEYSSELEISIGIPEMYSLDQNFPNPFNPLTIIGYSLPSDSKVTIKIFSLLGQDLVTIKDEIVYAGNHSVEFNAADLSSGIYFYSINATGLADNKSFRSVKKMVVLK